MRPTLVLAAALLAFAAHAGRRGAPSVPDRLHVRGRREEDCSQCELVGGPALDFHIGGLLTPRVSPCWRRARCSPSTRVARAPTALVGAVQFWPIHWFWLNGGFGVAETGSPQGVSDTGPIRDGPGRDRLPWPAAVRPSTSAAATSGGSTRTTAAGRSSCRWASPGTDRDGRRPPVGQPEPREAGGDAQAGRRVAVPRGGPQGRGDHRGSRGDRAHVPRERDAEGAVLRGTLGLLWTVADDWGSRWTPSTAGPGYFTPAGSAGKGPPTPTGTGSFSSGWKVWPRSAAGPASPVRWPWPRGPTSSSRPGSPSRDASRTPRAAQRLRVRPALLLPAVRADVRRGPPEDKDRVSHRGKAFARLREFLKGRAEGRSCKALGPKRFA